MNNITIIDTITAPMGMGALIDKPPPGVTKRLVGGAYCKVWPAYGVSPDILYIVASDPLNGIIPL